MKHQLLQTTRLILFVLFGLLTLGCFPSKKSVTEYKCLEFIVRDSDTDTLLTGVQIDLDKFTGKTNTLGYAAIHIGRSGHKELKLHQDLYIKYGVSTSSGEVRDSFRFNPYLNLYPLYLSVSQDGSGSSTPAVSLDSSMVFADMHYHASLKTHNCFGHELYPANSFESAPDNLFWYKNFDELQVMYNGRLKNAAFGDFKNPNGSRYKRMKLLLENKVYPKRTMNPLIHYTQATNDHRKEGRVHLAYNSISPFETNVANSGAKRKANTWFVTGAATDWLNKIGYKDAVGGRLTPWRNFRNEFAYINSQALSSNSFNYTFYEPGSDINPNRPTMINVIEGGHIFQNHIFPSTIVYDFDHLDSVEINNLCNQTLVAVRKLKVLFDKDSLPSEYDPLEFFRLYLKHQSVIQDKRIGRLENKSPEKQTTIYITQNQPASSDTVGLMQAQMAEFVDDFYKFELSANVKQLKEMGSASQKVRMITIAHFSYNGLFGQANPLDGGKFPNNLVARKSYAIRVSDDHTYLKQWAGSFFTIPGVTKYGKFVAEKLAYSDANEHPIYIDLKHTDYIGRSFFYDSLMIKDVYPPICSHCAANGLPEYMYSPAVNEYMIVKTKSVNRFYPFQINLYNEEIPRYFKNGGIIGIVFEERALGSYINNKIGLYPDGRKKMNRMQFNKTRICGVESPGPELAQVIQQYRDSLVFDITSKRKINARIKNAVLQDYSFIEPFLNNLFYFIDNSGIGFDSVAGIDKAWMQLCIGSDLDGMIDPINLCPTASVYPRFKELVRLYIPFYLEMRSQTEFRHPTKNKKADYFLHDDSMDRALDYLFYVSLRNFTTKYMKS